VWLWEGGKAQVLELVPDKWYRIQSSGHEKRFLMLRKMARFRKKQ
jgi:hypothetical protein